MVTKSPIGEATRDLFLITMNEQRLRKVVSDVSSEIDKFMIMKINDLETLEEVTQIGCECCGIKEECTQTYINQIQESFSGKWVCGLCSEAVKERMVKVPHNTKQDAINFHKEFCQSFNATTRMNPKLSLTLSMRNIAKQYSEKRSTSSDNGVNNSRVLARSRSCIPRIGLKN